jgi:virginiamycin B lyase
VFGRRLAGHTDHAEHPHPLRRRIVLTIVAAALLAAVVLLLAPPHAHGNFVYWTTQDGTTIGRAKINGAGQNNSFITTTSDSATDDPHGVAVDSHFIYWSHGDAADGAIGRANLDGSGVNPNFIPHMTGLANPFGVAVTPSAIYWVNGQNTVGRANLDGSGADPSFLTAAGFHCGIAADSNFIYWTDSSPGFRIGRAGLDGSAPDPNFLNAAAADARCGIAVDPSFLYWGTNASSVGRATVSGGSPNKSFLAATEDPCGVAVNSQFVFWINGSTIGRANVGGGGANTALIPNVPGACMLAAAPSNKITIDSVTKNKKKGTATINAKVPGPGQVSLTDTGNPDVNATAASVKQQGLTISAASSFKLAVKPVGKTAKKLKKQLKKKSKAKVKVQVFVDFVPAGVAGVPNSEPVTITLVKQRKKK